MHIFHEIHRIAAALDHDIEAVRANVAERDIKAGVARQNALLEYGRVARLVDGILHHHVVLLLEIAVAVVECVVDDLPGQLLRDIDRGCGIDADQGVGAVHTEGFAVIIRARQTGDVIDLRRLSLCLGIGVGGVRGICGVACRVVCFRVLGSASGGHEQGGKQENSDPFLHMSNFPSRCDDRDRRVV